MFYIFEFMKNGSKKQKCCICLFVQCTLNSHKKAQLEGTYLIGMNPAGINMHSASLADDIGHFPLWVDNSVAECVLLHKASVFIF